MACGAKKTEHAGSILSVISNCRFGEDMLYCLHDGKT